MFIVTNLKKVYKSKKGEDVVALNGINLSFPGIGLVFIVGRSGCGKTTLLNMLAGLDTFTSGEIEFGGKNFSELTEKEFNLLRRFSFGFVFQERNLLNEFNVYDNIDIFVRMQGRVDKQAIKDSLAVVGLAGYEQRYINELSGGQKQRVAVARALAKNSKVIFADEPTGALDEKTAKSLFEMLKSVSKEKLVIAVSHDLGFAKQYADVVIELSEGEIKSDIWAG